MLYLMQDSAGHNPQWSTIARLGMGNKKVDQKGFRQLLTERLLDTDGNIIVPLNNLIGYANYWWRNCCPRYRCTGYWPDVDHIIVPTDDEFRHVAFINAAGQPRRTIVFGLPDDLYRDVPTVNNHFMAELSARNLRMEAIVRLVSELMIPLPPGVVTVQSMSDTATQHFVSGLGLTERNRYNEIREQVRAEREAARQRALRVVANHNIVYARVMQLPQCHL